MFRALFSSSPLSPRWAAFRRFLGFVGPGFMIAVGYMDPGNWATDLEGGSAYGYMLLWVILLSNLLAILLQHLCVRLQVATGLDLAQACQRYYSPAVSRFLWLMAQVGIIAMDLAELLGSAIALQILFNIPLFLGAVITAGDVLLLLALHKLGYRWLESLVGVLIFTIALCLGIELCLAKVEMVKVWQGFIPDPAILHQPRMLFVALGIIGATVMPHNLYLHSSIVGTRSFGTTEASRREALRFGTYDVTLALIFAFLVNASLLILSAAAFHGRPEAVTDIREAHHLLNGVLGSTFAGTLFACALLASGQNATITGTLAGQIVIEGFLKVKPSAWVIRVITRVAALIPALLVIGLAGERYLDSLLMWSQVVLSLQLGFACWPLVRLTGNAAVMGSFKSPAWLQTMGWMATTLVVGAGIWFIANGIF